VYYFESIIDFPGSGIMALVEAAADIKIKAEGKRRVRMRENCTLLTASLNWAG